SLSAITLTFCFIEVCAIRTALFRVAGLEKEDKIPPSSSTSSLPTFSWSQLLFPKWPPASSTKSRPDLGRWQQRTLLY
nr:hypothetical protein [Tanacetum cinerariifolium]